MPKGINKKGVIWGPTVDDDDEFGNTVYVGEKSKKRKKMILMEDRVLPDGSPQPLYFPPEHKHTGLFKEMAQILIKRGLTAEAKLNAECKNFKCNPAQFPCCCWRVLFNQPDFVGVKSELEEVIKAQGHLFLMLPKFHCKLNPEEQCWGYAKQQYCDYPWASYTPLQLGCPHAIPTRPRAHWPRSCLPCLLVYQFNKIWRKD